MFAMLRQALSKLKRASPEETSLPKDGLPNGALIFRALSIASLGEEGAADLERRLDEFQRECDYRDRVARMESLAALRRRELAAQRELESLR